MVGCKLSSAKCDKECFVVIRLNGGPVYLSLELNFIAGQGFVHTLYTVHCPSPHYAGGI